MQADKTYGEKTGPANHVDAAAALRFDPAENRAPRVVAAGFGNLAREIVSVARQNGTPVIRDPELSVLAARLPVGREIPENLYHVIAGLFGLVYRLKQNQ